MLTNNKTYDDTNIRDRSKTFNMGRASFYKANERILGEKIGEWGFSIESVKYQQYAEGHQNSTTGVRAIGIIAGGPMIDSGDIAILDDSKDEFYIVEHVEFQSFARPNWYKVYMHRSTTPYETVQQL